MVRIVGVQRSPRAEEEFVLLQNQGVLHANLRGYAVVADSQLGQEDGIPAMHIFCDDVDIPAGHFVLLRTCSVPHRWTVMSDGHRVYCAGMSRHGGVWDRCEGRLLLLKPQHSFLPPQLATAAT